MTSKQRETEFRAFIKSLGLKHFTAQEFINYSRRTRNGVKNSLPPKYLWRNIVPAIIIVDALRAKFGKSCTLLSTYRSPAYNRAVGGAKRSQHLQFNALDIAFNGVTPSKVFNTLKSWRLEGVFDGGLGLYTSSGFVHIDTRGYKATWGK